MLISVMVDNMKITH